MRRVLVRSALPERPPRGGTMGRRNPTARLENSSAGSGPVVTFEMPARDPLAGSVIHELYQLAEQIGEGGMGLIYRAQHVRTAEPLAVKLLHPELGRTGEMAQRFEREAQSVSRLSHPNIVRVVESGRTESGTLFLVMELLHGESL